MTTEYKYGYIAGLEEAYRLSGLNDLDFAPGRILKRIKQMKTTPDTTEPDRTSMSREQLESALAQREDQLRQVEARLKESAKDWADDDTAIREICKPYLSELGLNGDSYGVPTMIEVVRRAVDKVEAQCWAMREVLADANHYFSNCERLSLHDSIDARRKAQRKVEEALSTDCGKSILARLEEARRLLLKTQKATFDTGDCVEWCRDRDSWLSGHTPTGQSDRALLETARDLLSRCPGIRTDETREYWDEVQAFLGRVEK